MKAHRNTGAALVAIAAAWIAGAAPARFDFGPEGSDVWPGFQRITASGTWTAKGGHGWRDARGLSARARAHRQPVENERRGATEPPPIWTNAITEDAVLGTTENAFQFRTAPGEYEIYIVCGTSDPANRSQFFDFDVTVGAITQRVQIEGPYQFRTLRFRTTAGTEPVSIGFAPRSKWVVNAIVAWTPADAEAARREFIEPFEEWTFRLPPEEWAKWQREPRPEEPMLPPRPADVNRGFVLYHRHYLEPVYPETRPRAEDLDFELRLFATPGEYATTSFVVLPLRALRDAQVTVSAIGPVTPQDIDVRRVRYFRARPNYRVQHRYRVVPDVLERFSGGGLPAGENARIWLTLRIPEDAPAGHHAGSVTFRHAGGEVSIPVRLRVLPFRLREDPGRIFGIYYRHPLDLAASAPDEVSRAYFRRKAELEHQDMVAHGTRNVVLSVSARPAKAPGEYTFNWDLLAAKLALWRRHRFTGPVVLGFPAELVYEQHLKERPGSHLRGVKDPPEGFSRDLTAMVRAIESERQRRGWPEFLYYPIDEPGTESAAVEFMVKVLQACKAAGVRTYVTADPTRDAFQPLRPYVDVWCTQPFAPEREVVLADMAARPVEYWCYPNHVNGENDHTPVAGARMTYGFGFWRSGFRALIPWIYQASTGDPFNYLDGASMDFFNRSEPDGTPIPVAMWEAYRQGYNDHRYLHTLEQRIAAAKISPQPAARAVAAEAEAELREMWNAIRVLPKYQFEGLWAPEDFDAYRWIVARRILAIDGVLDSSSVQAGQP